MSQTSDKRSEEFLAISGQFKLGALTTELSHPVTADLSEAARQDVSEGLRLLFEADADVLRKYQEIVGSGLLEMMRDSALRSLRNGGKMFFTGCGSTGRLSIQLVSIWRDFWQKKRQHPGNSRIPAEELEQRAISVMAGGDFALIKAVEGFEDFATFGKKQIRDLGVAAGDVVFAITEGGETSFVIGTAWQGVEAGAKVYFVYNNPDTVLCEHVQRSREIIQEPSITKVNLTTGPMSITGSTRMQATTIQLCVLLTVMEMVVQELTQATGTPVGDSSKSAEIPLSFLHHLETMHATLKSDGLRQQLGRMVALEESVYRSGHRNNYFADRFGIDLLTDTTERSPTFCIPPFRKFDDQQASESWAFLFIPAVSSQAAWTQLLKRPPKCVEWTAEEIRDLVSPDKLDRTLETVRKISAAELTRFRIGLDGLPVRPSLPGDSAIAVIGPGEGIPSISGSEFYQSQLEAAAKAGASVGLIHLSYDDLLTTARQNIQDWNPSCALVSVAIPRTGFLLDGVTRVGLKMLLNALSTSVMVRLGRVMGNYMIYVVPSNLKLIDRATRYIQKLAGLEYEAANRLLFEVIEYVEPRMKADQAYPPVVGMAVYRARHGVDNARAEEMLVSPTPV